MEEGGRCEEKGILLGQLRNMKARTGKCPCAAPLRYLPVLESTMLRKEGAKGD
jgi:hypothetical protein